MSLRRLDRRRDVGPMVLEALETRALLSAAFPNISTLEDPFNTVVRMETNLGCIDIEMLEEDAPNTVANFLKYVRDGDLDLSFFHRSVAAFVVQGGGFRFTNEDSVTNVPTDAPIVNEFRRSNEARTVAMAKLGGDPNSATSQFFFNLVDNSANLDFQNGGFTVFARVVDNASWNVVLDIAALPRQNFSGSLGGAFTAVPVVQTVPGGENVQEEDLVRVLNIEIIKPADTQLFYTNAIYYPEGFAGGTINEFLPIENDNSVAVNYQVIAHAEVADGDTDFYRDRVIATGTIAPHSRGGITVSRFTNPTNDLLPRGVPYALELRSTAPLAANLSHFDFGSATGEGLTAETSTTWVIADAQKDNGNIFDFLVWQNTASEDATLNITFYFRANNQNTSSTAVVTTDAQRRGGLNLSQMAQIPDGVQFSIKIVADQPIVAALTHFEPAGVRSGFTALGAPGAGSRLGVIPMARTGENNDHFISVYNPGSVLAVVNLFLSFDTGNPINVTPLEMLVQPNARVTYNLEGISEVADGRTFSLRYSSNTAIFMHSRNEALFGDDGDGVSHPVATTASTDLLFAEGFMDPARAGDDVIETLSLYNPNSLFFTGQDSDAEVAIQFLYGDGFVVTINRTIAGGARLDLDLHTLQEVLDQGNNNQRFFYSIRVTADLPMIAQFWHFDLTLGNLQPSGGFGTLGSPLSTAVDLSALGGGGG